jgi:hypothetical protein
MPGKDENSMSRQGDCGSTPGRFPGASDGGDAMTDARGVLILVENLPSPFDRRVWQEATALRDAGYAVSIICPSGRGCERRFEIIDDIHIHRYHLPVEASGAFGYALEYAVALTWTLLLSLKVAFTRGFDVVHACNPPDLLSSNTSRSAPPTSPSRPTNRTAASPSNGGGWPRRGSSWCAAARRSRG